MASTLTEDVDHLTRRLLAELVPQRRALRRLGSATGAAVPECTPQLFRLGRVIADLLAAPLPPRSRKAPARRLPTVGEALTEGPLVRHFPEVERRYVGVPVPELEE